MSTKLETTRRHADAPWQGIASRYSILLFVIGVLFALFMIEDSPPILLEHRFILPILIGMIAFPSLIMTIVDCFRVLASYGMASKYHAFALPPGSIRAVLAMGFIILVMVFGVYLITEIKTPQTRLLILSEKVIAGDFRPMGESDAGPEETPEQHAKRDEAAKAELARETSKKIDQLRQLYGRGFVVADDTSKNRNVSTINVYMLSDNDRVANLAQQILTMLATALTAIVGFYFGSRTANEPEQTNAINQPDPALLTARDTLAKAISKAGQEIETARKAWVEIDINIIPEDYKDLLKSGGGLDVYLERQTKAIGAQVAVFDNAEATLAQVTEAKGTCEKISGDAAEIVTALQDLSQENLKKVNELTAA